MRTDFPVSRPRDVMIFFSPPLGSEQTTGSLVGLIVRTRAVGIKKWNSGGSIPLGNLLPISEKAGRGVFPEAPGHLLEG